MGGDGQRGHTGPTWRAWAGFLVVMALLGLLLEGWWILTVPEPLRGSSRVVEVPAHKGVVEVAEILDEAGVIQSRVGFVLLALARGSFRTLKAGEYQIPPGSNTVRVLEQIAGGQVLQHMVTSRKGAPSPSSRVSSRPSGSSRPPISSGWARTWCSSRRSISRPTRWRAISSRTPTSSSRA
jgi:hypothetical protein